jgi:hypothetical protein
MKNTKRNWRDRVSDEIKALIDIDAAALEFERRIKDNLSKGLPENNARIIARKNMAQLLKRKGVNSSDATHFLHVTEKAPYNGCGCCRHRKPIKQGNYYD